MVAHHKKTHSLSTYLDGVGGRAKLTRLMHCVGLACYEIDAGIMRDAGSVVIHQDVSKLKLLVRFSLCTPDLHVAKGVLGLAKLKNGSHKSLLEATELVVRQFCCDDAPLIQHMQDVTESRLQ